MKYPWLSVLLSLVLLPACGVSGSALAQDADNDTIAAAKKAALFIEGRGVAPIKPTSYYLQIEIFAEGQGRSTVQAEYEKNIEIARTTLSKIGFITGQPNPPQTFLKASTSSYQAVPPDSQIQPDATLKVTSTIGLGASTPAKVQEVFDALRASGMSGRFTVNYSVDDDEAARRAALKAAIAQAKQRVQVLSEAAKPKEFDLVYLKEGEFQMDNVSTSADLQGKQPLQILNAINANINLVLFYGFKPMPPVKVAMAPPKAVAKPAKKP